MVQGRRSAHWFRWLFKYAGRCGVHVFVLDLVVTAVINHLCKEELLTNCAWDPSLRRNVKICGNRPCFSRHLLILGFCGINKLKCLSLSNGATRGEDWSERGVGKPCAAKCEQRGAGWHFCLFVCNRFRAPVFVHWVLQASENRRCSQCADFRCCVRSNVHTCCICINEKPTFLFTVNSRSF